MVLSWVIAALAAVAGATLSALALAFGRTHLVDGAGLNATLAWIALSVGIGTGAAAFTHTRRRAGGSVPRPTGWAWLMFAVFAVFAGRAFCWLMYWDGDTVRILSPNNLGDLPRHLLYARFFADGAPWWPPHPLHAWASLRYYPGIDLFGSLLLLAGVDERHLLVWVGLGGSAATAIALWRWGGAFTLAAFLFNGGLGGWEILRTGRWLDYQGPLAWKSLPLAIFVTQRGFLFALPAGLLLLTHWRERLFEMRSADCGVRNEEVPHPASRIQAPVPPHSALRIPHSALLLPFWVEVLLLVALAFFQLYAALFLIGLLVWWGLVYFGRVEVRRHVGKLLVLTLPPIFAEVALMTGGFARGNSLWLKPGWMQGEEGFWRFWALNFGFSLLLAAGLWVALVWRLLMAEDTGTSAWKRAATGEAAEAFVLPAGMAFLTTCVVMFAPWEWDNTKLMLWSYLAAAPFVWERLLAARGLTWRVPVCGLLFLSGAVSLVGGLRGGKDGKGLELARRSELDAVRVAVHSVPRGERFACSPDYNHPLVLNGRMVAMGYAGALVGYGLDYKPLERTLRTLMLGRPGWEDAARQLGVRYVFWGARETKSFPNSTRPWETLGREPIARGEWGAIYELPP